jgi:uncharacterized membrane protein
MIGLNFISCHRKPERSFFYKGIQFPVCARCTGLSIGMSTLLLFAFQVWYLPIGICCAFILPTYFDGILQAYFNMESNNWRRLVTGVFAGVGLMGLTTHIANFIVNFFCG